ncbi:MAG: DAK2 domain-containing protein [Clostridia bacterium]|nr:DAK2 domain-containing protein [Clostridia bacterium]
MNYKSEKLLNGEIYGWMLKCAACELKFHIKDVNDLNVFPVPDGDTGDNMWRTINGGVNALATCKTEDLPDAVVTSSKGMIFKARGNSGVILSQFFKGITLVLSGSDSADAAKLIEALRSGVKHSYAAVLNPMEGTILTVARESAEYAAKNVKKDAPLSELFAKLLTGMKNSLKRTPELLPVLKQAGVIDSGGAGLYYIAAGFSRALNEDVEKTKAHYGIQANLVDGEPDQHSHADNVNVDLFTADDVMKYGYCTELLIRLQNSRTDIESFDDDAVRRFLSEAGDSVVYFRSESLVKLHVHTFDPERVMSYMHNFGEFLKIKIENMTLEHTDNDSPVALIDLASDRIEQSEGRRRGSGSELMDEFGLGQEEYPEKKFFGTVAVCAGSGFAETFKAMGCDALVSGGQSMNPSTQDFIDAFKNVNAEHIIVFPNNKNIVLSARQAADLYTDAAVHVVETSDLGQGYVGLSAIYPDETDIDSIIASIEEAVSSSSSGAVSNAVKSGNFDGVAVSEGDFIGFIGKKIISSEQDVVSAAMLLTDRLIASSESGSIITCFTGRDTDSFENSILEKAIAEKYPDTEVFFTSGGQEVYSYILVAD